MEYAPCPTALYIPATHPRGARPSYLRVSVSVVLFWTSIVVPSFCNKFGGARGVQSNQQGDQKKATSLLDESLALSTELGMRTLMERVLSRREILKA